MLLKHFMITIIKKIVHCENKFCQILSFRVY